MKPSDSFSMQGYRIYRKDRICANPSIRNVGGGVAIAIRNDIPHFQLPNINTKIIETIGLEVNGIQFYAVYLTGSRLSPEKYSHFKEDIKKLTSIRKKYFLGCDLNSKHRFWNCIKSNKAGNILYNEMISREFLLVHPPVSNLLPAPG